jgi:glutaminyl-peptide cyclotransferase
MPGILGEMAKRTNGPMDDGRGKLRQHSDDKLAALAPDAVYQRGKGDNKTKQSHPRSLLASVMDLRILLWLLLGVAATWASHEKSKAKLVSSENPQSMASESMVERILPPQGPWLLPLLQVRYPGSAGNRRVRQFLQEQVGNLTGWTLDASSSVPFTVADSPNGPMEFQNLVFTFHPANQSASSFVVLAAHYDSKFSSNEGDVPDGFVGATDSAWPCALLLFLAESISRLVSQSASMKYGVKLVFFDGEEALRHWGAHDSLYGSRQLANQWHQQGFFAQIRLFALFDLLGSADMHINCLGGATAPEYDALRRKLLEQSASPARAAQLMGERRLPIGATYQSFIMDDHTPFQRLGLQPVLHLISSPFPSVWHSLGDDASALDAAVCRDFAQAVRDFVQDLLLS